MAVKYDAPNTSYAYINSSPVTVFPITIAHWATSTSSFNNCGLVGVFREGPGGGADGLYTAGSDGHLACVVVTNGVFIPATSTSTVTDGTWNHITATFSSSVVETVYFNGANPVTANPGSSGPAGINKTVTGSFWNSASAGTGGSNQIVSLAEVAIWNAALSAGEAASLAKGYSPLLIRPDNLVYYVPLVRTGTQDLIGAPLTENGSPTVVTHPAVIRPKRRT